MQKRLKCKLSRYKITGEYAMLGNAIELIQMSRGFVE